MESVFCETCNARDKQMTANHWCMDCEERLCNECTEIHKVHKMSKSHHLIKLQEKPKDLNLQSSCIKHNLPIDYFCVDHYDLCCKECLALSHRTCQKVQSLDIASLHAKESEPFVDTCQQLDHILHGLRCLLGNGKSNVDNIRAEAKSVKDEILDIKQRMINRLNQVEESLISELNHSKEAQISEIQSKIHEIEQLFSKIQERKNEFEFIQRHGSDKHAFIVIQAAQHYLQETESKVQKLVENSNILHVTFIACADIPSMAIGKIDKTESLCNDAYVPFKHFQSQTPVLEQRKCETFTYLNDLHGVRQMAISGMTFTDDNLLLLCDANYELHVYNQNERFIRSIGLKNIPWDVAPIPKTSKAVVSERSMPFIQFVEVSSGTLEERVEIKGQCAFGISATNDHLLLGGRNQINVLDHRGKHLKFLTSSNIVDTIAYLTTTPNGTILFTCSSKPFVYAVDNTGHDVFVNELENMKNPRKIVCDNRSNLYVVGENTHNILKLTSDGKPVKIILSQKNKLERPLTMCFDKSYSKLYVSNNRGNRITVFKVD